MVTARITRIRSWLARGWAKRKRIRLIGLLRVLGLARRAVPKPVIGPKAYVQWWRRILAAITLAALSAGIGLALAAGLSLMVLVAGFLLEQAIA